MNPKYLAIGIGAATAVIAFLLSQPDVPFGPGVKVALGAIQVGLVYVSLKLNLNP